MKTNVKKVLLGLASLLLTVALIVIAPVSRLVYGIYDANRTNTILKQLEAEENASNSQDVQVNDFRKQAFYATTQDADGGKTVEKMDLLVLTSDSDYEISYYERIVDGSTSYTARFFHMMGKYTRNGNVLTVEPGVGVLALSSDGVSYTYYNAQYLTAEEAGGDKTRDEVYDMQYTSREIALMQDGTFVVGGTSDATDEITAPEGRKVYTDAMLQGRVTYKTLVTLDDTAYILYSLATNSNNAEQTTGSLFGYGSYELAGTGIAPDDAVPEQTYDIVSGDAGVGYMYANNNGSHMHFDLQNEASFLSWLSTSFNASSPTFYVTETGFTVKVGALKTVVNPWGLYVPAEDAGESGEQDVGESIKLELETSVEGKPFVLELNADGTLRTGWTNYDQTMMDGTWTAENGTLVLDAPYETTITANANGGLDITVNYGQMGEKVYTLTAEQYTALTGEELAAAPAGESVVLEVETSVEGKPFVLELNADGTLRTGWTNYEQTMMEGTWWVEYDIIIFDMPYDYGNVLNDDGSITISIDYDQMGEKTYTLTAEQFAALAGGAVVAPAGENVVLELETSVEGKPFVLELNGDGTLRTGWTNYEQTMMDGTWTAENGTLVLDAPYESTVVTNAEGGLTITVNYDQMGEKVYTMSAEQYAALTGAFVSTFVGEDVVLEVETSVEGKPFVLELNGDGTLRTGWTNYEQTMMDGTWTAENGTLVLDAPYGSTITANADASFTITVNYDQMGEKVYTLTATQYSALTGETVAAHAREDLVLEVETSVEGKPFVLELNADGTLRTGWTNYEQTMKDGSWCISNGALALDIDYSSAVVVNEDGSMTITIDYDQMGEKTYTVTAEQAEMILN